MTGFILEDAKDKFKLWEQQWLTTEHDDSFRIKFTVSFFWDCMFAASS